MIANDYLSAIELVLCNTCAHYKCFKHLFFFVFLLSFFARFWPSETSKIPKTFSVQPYSYLHGLGPSRFRLELGAKRNQMSPQPAMISDNITPIWNIYVFQSICTHKINREVSWYWYLCLGENGQHSIQKMRLAGIVNLINILLALG